MGGGFFKGKGKDSIACKIHRDGSARIKEISSGGRAGLVPTGRERHSKRARFDSCVVLVSAFGVCSGSESVLDVRRLLYHNRIDFAALS